MSNLLTKDDLLSLEDYAIRRNAIRAKTIKIRQKRQINLGEHLRLLFENRETIAYQVQEMLRIEKIFEPNEIQEELDAYNPLIPTGKNLKATLMIEYSDIAERKKALTELIGVEKSIYFQVEGFSKVSPICNEDLTRENEEKTSSVHFMRFEFDLDMLTAFKNNTKTMLVVSHPHYQTTTKLSQALQDELKLDFC